MSDTMRPAVSIAIRIPGNWRSPEEMFERLPQGYRITEDRLILPDQTEMEIFLMPPDEEFAAVFRSTLRRPAAPEEMATVNRYTVNVGLRGPGGSLESARQMMRAGAAIVHVIPAPTKLPPPLARTLTESPKHCTATATTAPSITGRAPSPGLTKRSAFIQRHLPT